MPEATPQPPLDAIVRERVKAAAELARRTSDGAFTNAEAARRLGEPKGTVDCWFAGSRTPHVSDLPSLGELFGLPVSYFLGLESERIESLLSRIQALEDRLGELDTRRRRRAAA